MKRVDGGNTEHERLRKWLVERELDVSLAPEMRGVASSLSMPPKAIPEGEDDSVAPGQIRLLHPIEIDAHTPRYLAVLGAGPTPEHMIVVPFSRYVTPALPGEMLTQREALPLRVMCLWNACEVERQKLARMSWGAGELTDAERTDARQLSDSFNSGAICTEALNARLGPRLIHPGDPRHAYIEEERTWQRLLRDEAPTLAEKQLRIYPHVLSDESPPARAAESRAAYGRDRYFDIDRFALRLRCDYAPDDRHARIQVIDSQGRRSTRLDGGHLLTVDGRSTASIWNGQCRIQASESISRVVTAEGNTRPLIASS